LHGSNLHKLRSLALAAACSSALGSVALTPGVRLRWSCKTDFLETHGTPLHGKRVPPEVLVWVVGALAEGLGIRAVARVFAVAPNTVLQWLIEVADHAAAFSRYFLHDVQGTQVQLDELFAVLNTGKAGEVSEGKAPNRLSHSPCWVWVALST